MKAKQRSERAKKKEKEEEEWKKHLGKDDVLVCARTKPSYHLPFSGQIYVNKKKKVFEF